MTVLIAGAGIGGLTTALMLHQRGIKVLGTALGSQEYVVAQAESKLAKLQSFLRLVATIPDLQYKRRLQYPISTPGELASLYPAPGKGWEFY